MQKIDLRSDTITRPSHSMREYMMQAEVGDDVFGEDPTVNRLQNKIANLLSKEDALFVPSGTQANQICVNAHTQPGQEVIVDYNAHIFNYESGSGGMLSGIQLHPIIGKNGFPSVDQIKEVIRPFDDHYPQTCLICLENTHNRAGGTIFPLQEIIQISNLAKENNLKLHLDGARLWNASVATGIALSEYAKYFDSVSLCFSKGLGAPIGSIVVGSKEFIKKAHFYRKAYGGGMRQIGIIAAACEYALENNYNKLKIDHQNAKKIAETLNSLPSIAIELESVQSNLIIFDISKMGKSASDVCLILEENGVLVLPFGPTKIRMVTHLDVSVSEIDEVCKILLKILN
jgi:threonine aldolase